MRPTLTIFYTRQVLFIFFLPNGSADYGWAIEAYGWRHESQISQLLSIAPLHMGGGVAESHDRTAYTE